MSSRVRLFLADLLRGGIWAGNRAVAQLKKMYTEFGGRAIRVVESNDRIGGRAYREMPLVPRTPLAVIPEGLSKEKLVTWLWERLPSTVKKYTQIVLVREARSKCWRSSLSNRFGKKRKPARAAFTVGTDWLPRTATGVQAALRRTAVEAPPRRLNIGVWQ